MNTYTFDKENKTIKFHKDCRKCVHLNVCVFHNKIDEFARQNSMYAMNEYAEHNNILRTFEFYTSCNHYENKFKHVIGQTPNLESDSEIINEIVYNEVKLTKEKVLAEQYPQHKDNVYFFFSPNVKIDIKSNTYSLVLKTTDKEIGHGTVVYEDTRRISELLEFWKFI